ncbi:unnamed protein product [Parajaminaea phylloscopi]
MGPPLRTSQSLHASGVAHIRCCVEDKDELNLVYSYCTIQNRLESEVSLCQGVQSSQPRLASPRLAALRHFWTSVRARPRRASRPSTLGFVSDAPDVRLPAPICRPASCPVRLRTHLSQRSGRTLFPGNALAITSSDPAQLLITMADSPTKSGIRDLPKERAPLLDDDGELLPPFEDALAYIFQKYATVPSSSPAHSAPNSQGDAAEPSTPSKKVGAENEAATHSPRKSSPTLGSRPPRGAVITDVGLDRFAYDTNGSPLPQESKDELKEFMDCDDQGRLTFAGFLQMYHLQADNDLEETWKDLSTHGFQGNLELVSTRRETSDAHDAGIASGSKQAQVSQHKEHQQTDTTAQDPATTLLTPLHVKHILKLSSNKSSLAYHLTTHLRMNGVYWGLGALEVMGQGHLLDSDELLTFVTDCWDSTTGGFGSFPGHDAHVLSTCSAVQILAIKDRLDAFGTERLSRVADFLVSLQNPASGLCWGDGTRLEEDNRFLYCAVNALAHLGALDRLDCKGAVEGVLSCLNFDGGFGRVKGAESHASQAFTCVGVLTILGAVDRLDRSKVAGWLSERQLPNGGLNGRPQKLEDVCYSWWVLTALSMLGKLSWIDSGKLTKFILSAQDPDLGGIADRPDNVTDVYHTFFGCAGLSLLGYPGLQPIDPVYAMPRGVVERLGIERPYQRLDVVAG